MTDNDRPGVFAYRDASRRRCSDDVFGQLQRLTDAELGTEAEFVLEGGGAETAGELGDETVVVPLSARRT